MSENPPIIELQRRQEEHDRGHHRDIYSLAYPERMTHYVLHFSKYVGRLSNMNPDANGFEDNLQKTLADSLIVALAAANTLNLDLDDQLQDMFMIEAEGVQSWAEQLNATEDEMSLEETRQWLFKRMAMPTGRMSNALESLDHMESVDTRRMLEENTLEVISNLLIAFENIGEPIGEVLDARWSEIERESIL